MNRVLDTTGWIDAPIGLMNASSGEVVNGGPAARSFRRPRRRNCSSTIRPVQFSQSLSRADSGGVRAFHV